MLQVARSFTSPRVYTSSGMDDSSLFLHWAVSTLQHQHPAAVAVVADDDATFFSFQELCDTEEVVVVPVQEEVITEAHGGGASRIGLAVAVDEHGGWSRSPNPGARPPSGGCGSNNLPLMSWDFSAASVAVQVQPNGGGGGGAPEMAYGSPPAAGGSTTRKTSAPTVGRRRRTRSWSTSSRSGSGGRRSTSGSWSSPPSSPSSRRYKKSHQFLNMKCSDRICFRLVIDLMIRWTRRRSSPTRRATSGSCKRSSRR
ncbi:Os03g0671000 [Oryza sativa Japonica Group]|uniref:Os03g0671000 protein n=1 Tax=Oryza sativa subsp. japonica TaxID=39947 RepID=A0A0N7KHT2_ORYSJ|nr:hypothetical protein EE612_019567 [Oryza sativa]BAS85689.1 Os03g0671000 [Oryza sativa Japonica Group]